MMTQSPIPSLPTTGQATDRMWSLRSTLVSLFIASFIAFAMVSTVRAGTYVINNCPSAPTPNSDPGPWVSFGGTQQSKASCSNGTGDWIGPRGASMNANSFAGVQVTVPMGSTSTIREAKVWWAVPSKTSGADNYAIAYANGGEVGTSKSPPEWITTPDVFVLPSTTTTFKVTDYCSNDDASQPCNFGTGLNPNLELYGAQLTIADNHIPTAKAISGGLTGTGALSGSQSLAYSAEDTDSGVRLVQLLINGQPAAENSYASDCAYTNFQACPASESDTITWNTATVTDGQHNIQAVVQDAAQNTSTFYDGTITTQNAPINTSLPTIIADGQPAVGTTLSTQPGAWSTPPGAGNDTYSYEWNNCDAQGDNCQDIPGAQNATYTPAPSDIGHTLRVIVHASDNDGANFATSTASNVVLSGTGSLGALPGPGTSPNQSAGSNGISSSSNAPNGMLAAEAASIHLGVSHTISRSFAKRAIKITGRLTDTQNHPILGASLDVIQQTAGSNTHKLIKHAQTASGGAFAITIPAGPSRRIEIAYRAFANDPGYAATATVVEIVSAGVRLHINTRDTTSTGTIVLEGQVSGPIPHQGSIVELLVHYRGQWEPFRAPRTNSHGHFKVPYQFQGATGRFPFRAEIPSGQASFPYGRGYSNIVYVATG